MHAGEIAIHSRVGHGTTVTVRLHLDSSAIGRGGQRDGAESIWGHEG
jgi:hypothetical protein